MNRKPLSKSEKQNQKENEPLITMTCCRWQPFIPRYQAGLWHLAQWLEPGDGWGIPSQQFCGQALASGGRGEVGGFPSVPSGPQLKRPLICHGQEQGWGVDEWQPDEPPTALQPFPKHPWLTFRQLPPLQTLFFREVPNPALPCPIRSNTSKAV